MCRQVNYFPPCICYLEKISRIPPPGERGLYLAHGLYFTSDLPNMVVVRQQTKREFKKAQESAIFPISNCQRLMAYISKRKHVIFANITLSRLDILPLFHVLSTPNMEEVWQHCEGGLNNARKRCIIQQFQLSDIKSPIYSGETGQLCQFNIAVIGNSSTFPCLIYPIWKWTDSNVNRHLTTQGNVS